ncbi:hypothetical protein HYE28_03925 [Mycoplasmopsis bovis]|nr:hypothetical protein [Mycoplasmopsis bovis]QQH23108.1 hypothetical protein HYE28_03925 [Mycoplasmopsis bovis]
MWWNQRRKINQKLDQKPGGDKNPGDDMKKDNDQKQVETKTKHLKINITWWKIKNWPEKNTLRKYNSSENTKHLDEIKNLEIKTWEKK